MSLECLSGQRLNVNTVVTPPLGRGERMQELCIFRRAMKESKEGTNDHHAALETLVVLSAR